MHSNTMTRIVSLLPRYSSSFGVKTTAEKRGRLDVKAVIQPIHDETNEKYGINEKQD